jgi:hypothetical protein
MVQSPQSNSLDDNNVMSSSVHERRSHHGPIRDDDEDKHSDEWIADTVFDARPLLPKVAFCIGDLRDGLPMVSPMLSL